MDLGLKDRVALVTGASRGIGQAIALELAAEGCALAICARGSEALEATATRIAALGAEVLPLPLDVTAPGAAEQALEAMTARFGPCDILVSNVGGNRRGEFLDRTDVEWAEVLELNLLSHTRFARAVGRQMRARRAGTMLFVSSIFGREAGGANLSLYNTTKSALLSMAKILALELAPHGVRVNSLAPGSIRFPGGSWDDRCKSDPEGMAEFVQRNIPMGRFGSAEEVAAVAAFLVSRRAGWMTGACVNVDGGQSRSLI